MSTPAAASMVIPADSVPASTRRGGDIGVTLICRRDLLLVPAGARHRLAARGGSRAGLVLSPLTPRPQLSHAGAGEQARPGAANPLAGGPR